MGKPHMIEPPEVIEHEGQPAAVIHLQIPRDRINTEMAPAINEVLAVLAEQGVSPAGPLFAHHLTQSNETFDFEVGFPVNETFNEAGRVQRSRLPSGPMAHTCHVGAYEELFSSWQKFNEWLTGEEASKLNLKKGDTLFEIYSTGPETTDDSGKWRTDLYQTLKG
jgi:effector-binding domain-containing protein